MRTTEEIHEDIHRKQKEIRALKILLCEQSCVMQMMCTNAEMNQTIMELILLDIELREAERSAFEERLLQRFGEQGSRVDRLVSTLGEIAKRMTEILSFAAAKKKGRIERQDGD